MKPLDLESKLMDCWGVVEDINILFNYVMEAETLDRDHVANYLLGLVTIYGMKHSICFDEFEKVLKENQ